MLWTGWPLQWKTFTASEAELNISADCLMILIEEATLQHGISGLHPELNKVIGELVNRGAFQGKSGQTAMLPTLGMIPQPFVLLVGIDPATPSAKSLRAAAGSAGGKLIEYQIEKLVYQVPDAKHSVKAEYRAAASAFIEGLLLGLYRRNNHSRSGRIKPAFEEINFIVHSEAMIEEWNEGVTQGLEIADAVCYARELTNSPANRLTPKRLSEEAMTLAQHFGMECKIYDEQEAATAGMGGLLAVGRGSANPPSMIVIHYRGLPASSRTLGLIGKGVTFDTGGISLKKAAGMEEMISDMGGAAAVMGVMRAIGSQKPAMNIVAVIPAAENMPSGSAYKPGDVIETYSGKTVEVLNTDAEGRIVLADGLTTALRYGATELIDVATLTGAVMHALGDLTTGAITNNEPFMESFLLAARDAGEYVWPLPAYPEYRTLLRSDVADLKNHGGAWAGAIAGGLFVGEFADNKPWIHLDIGGTAWMWDDRGLESKGGTGVMVRSLLTFIWNKSDTVGRHSSS